MPPSLLFDITNIDLNQVAYDQEAIRAANPQRGDMEHLNGIIWTEGVDILGFKDVREDEFWVPGHIPGRPLLPGVIMLEAAAQMASFYAHTILGWTGFIGFAGMEDVRFRASVYPGKRLLILSRKLSDRHRQIRAAAQGIVDGNLAFEAVIIGTRMGSKP
jgi:3-hydroxyacyl-[acyl-carrier-protein] dehydratase